MRDSARSRALLLLTWLSATGAFGSCNAFKPEDPPTGVPVTADFSTPDRTLATLAACVSDKNLTNGQDVYIHAFAESGRDGQPFRARFDQADTTGYSLEIGPRFWNRDREKQFYGRMVERYIWPYELKWEPYEPGGNDTDSLLHRKYTIDLIVPGGRVARWVGAADLHFTRSASADTEWVIKLWEDIRTPESNSNQPSTLGFTRLGR